VADLARWLATPLAGGRASARRRKQQEKSRARVCVCGCVTCAIPATLADPNQVHRQTRLPRRFL
jgi:hypothetical protein